MVDFTKKLGDLKPEPQHRVIDVTQRADAHFHRDTLLA